MNSEEIPDQKPRLFLLPGNKITAENIAALYKQLTGKDTTPAELEECRASLAAGIKSKE